MGLDRLRNPSCRGTGITAYHENGADIVTAQQMAAHTDIKTARLCDRTSDQVTLDEADQIEITIFLYTK